jgi:predicted acylesterase/phospholipase RssA
VEEIAEVLAAADREASTPLRRQRTNRIMAGLRNHAERGPGVMEILVGSLNIMQDRITRARLAGDPPEVMLTPRVSHIGMLEFDRAHEAIAEGRACVMRMLPLLKDAVGL